MIDMGHMQQAAQEATQMLRVLANENRLLLLCQLSQGEKSVGELETLLGIRQPTLSQQLGVLRNEGLVQTRREGKQIIYRVVDERAQRLLETLDTGGIERPAPSTRPPGCIYAGQIYSEGAVVTPTNGERQTCVPRPGAEPDLSGQMPLAWQSMGR